MSEFDVSKREMADRVRVAASVCYSEIGTCADCPYSGIGGFGLCSYEFAIEARMVAKAYLALTEGGNCENGK